MSEKIPISLHNSDLFLNPEFTDTNGNKINIDNAKKSPLKKRPSLGENNYVKSLRTPYLLPPSHNSAYLSKDVTSYLLTKQSLEKKDKTGETEQSDKKSQVKAKKKRYTGVESPFVKNPERLIAEQTVNKPNLAHSDTELDNAIKNSFTSLFLPVQAQFLDKLNRGFILFPNFGISVLQKLRFYKPREFLFVTTNLILFSVLAVVERSHYGKGSFRTSINKEELCFNKDEKQKHFVGVFSGESDINCCRTGVLQNRSCAKPKLCETEGVQNLRFCNATQRTKLLLKQPWYCMLVKASPLPKACNTWNNKVVATRSVRPCVALQNRRFCTPSVLHNSIFAQQGSNKEFQNKSKAFFRDNVHTNLTSCNNDKIQRFQYCMPFYKNQGHIFTESDTIPLKRGTIYSRTAKKNNTFGKFQANSSILCKTTPFYKATIGASQSILKRLFYRYGLLVVSPLKRVDESGTFKEADKDYLTKLRHVDETKTGHVNEIRQCLGLKNGCVLANNLKFVSYKKEQSKGNTHTAFFPSGSVKAKPSPFAWSRLNLAKLRFAKFVQVQDAVLTFGFVPDRLLENTSVSGYQFAELQEKEIAYLFRKQALFVGAKLSCKNEVVQNLGLCNAQQSCLAKPSILQRKAKPELCFAKTKLCKTEGYAKPKVLHATQGRAGTLLCKNFVFTRSNRNFIPALNQRLEGNARPDLICNLKTVDLPKSEVGSIKMQYTQVNLDEIKNIQNIFKKLGRDYEDYLRQPKDSLPALIISPSLEDDREIEEEGIQIFRKRDLIKNKRVNSEEKKSGQNIENTSFLSPMTPELPENKKISGKAVSKSEMQNHQLLVENALRQAQEEIESIVEEEKKGTEKDEEVLPPLTRLEALYTIRDREMKHEQAKDFISGKGIISQGLLPKNSAVPENKGVAKQTSLPVFEKLFLYSDKPNNYALPLKNRVFAQQDFGKEVKTKSEAFVIDNELGWILTPRLFSKLEDGNICVDRKHSFFGEMSLPAKKLTAQEQKQIFQQKTNPLLKIKTKNTELSSDLSVDRVSALDPHNFEFGSVVQKLSFCKATVPLPLLSRFSVLNKANHRKNEPPRFQVGAVNADLCFNESFGVQNRRLTNSEAVTVSKPSVLQHNARTNRNFVLATDFTISKNRIYFFDNLSQNKSCENSTPKIKGTPLESPVSHRVWQPKRVEPSTFRVPLRSKSTFVLPRISQKDWRNIMEWQLKKHFIEEDRRLLPLSLASKGNKKLKIKKVNLYLPWIFVKKATDFSLLHTEASNFANALHLPRTGATTTFLTKNKLNLSNKINFGPTVTGFLNESILSVDCKRTNYWRLPTQQNTYTANLRLSGKNEIFTSKQAQRTPFIKRSNQASSTLQSNNKQSLVQIPKKNLGISEKIFNESILFESVTKYSWLFVYTFVFFLMFKQLFTLIYKVVLKDFFLKFLNSDFGRTITSEEFRYSVQNSPLTESYMPRKRLKGLFGLERNKVQLLEIVWFLRNHCQGRNGPRGVLLVGPPGVESVSVVQAIAGEANLPIIVQSLEKIAQDNEPQRQLEQLYMRAHKQAPCVLFLDQLDSVGARRDQLFTDKIRGGNGSLFRSSGSSQSQDEQMGSSVSSQTSLNLHTSTSILNASPEVGLFTSHSESNNTITSNPFQRNQGGSVTEDYNVSINNGGTKQSFVSPGNKLNVVLRLLTILDGITQSSGVVTVATARDLTKLDPALLRPKRFDRRIYLSLPNQQDRVHLFKIQTQSLGHIKEMPWDYLSLQTENMSAVDIRSAINYSLFRAVLKNSVHTLETLEYGIDCVKSLTDTRVEKK